jgi:hypothetical protein
LVAHTHAIEYSAAIGFEHRNQTPQQGAAQAIEHQAVRPAFRQTIANIVNDDFLDAKVAQQRNVIVSAYLGKNLCPHQFP